MILIDWEGHLVSDKSLEELHTFAQRKLFLKREWFQDKKRKNYVPHYDVTTEQKRATARDAGAVVVDPQEIVRRAVRQ